MTRALRPPFDSVDLGGANEGTAMVRPAMAYTFWIKLESGVYSIRPHAWQWIVNALGSSNPKGIGQQYWFKLTDTGDKYLPLQGSGLDGQELMFLFPAGYFATGNAADATWRSYYIGGNSFNEFTRVPSNNVLPANVGATVFPMEVDTGSPLEMSAQTFASPDGDTLTAPVLLPDRVGAIDSLLARLEKPA